LSQGTSAGAASLITAASLDIGTAGCILSCLLEKWDLNSIRTELQESNIKTIVTLQEGCDDPVPLALTCTTVGVDEDEQLCSLDDSNCDNASNVICCQHHHHVEN
jgi:hypothetical protein